MNIISSLSKIIREITWSLSFKTILDKFDDMFLSSRLKRVPTKTAYLEWINALSLTLS